jgi:hypothetical protein
MLAKALLQEADLGRNKMPKRHAQTTKGLQNEWVWLARGFPLF